MSKLLLLSNSTLPGETFLGFAKAEIQSFLPTGNTKLIFIPYAAVTFGFEEYTNKVSEALGPLGFSITGIQETENADQAIQESEAIMVGGGNTFHLLREIFSKGLAEPIKAAVSSGVPYIGWSAGSNLACPSVMTTNDMPIVELPSLTALGLIPFQINPHYTDNEIPNNSGETRQARILEFLEVNPKQTVVGIPEGTFLKFDQDKLVFGGSQPALIFQKSRDPQVVSPGEDLTHLLSS